MPPAVPHAYRDARAAESNFCVLPLAEWNPPGPSGLSTSRAAPEARSYAGAALELRWSCAGATLTKAALPKAALTKAALTKAALPKAALPKAALTMIFIADCTESRDASF